MLESLKKLGRRVVERSGYAVYNRASQGVYSEDGFSTTHNSSFIFDPDFQNAYQRGIAANNGADHKMRWRAHVALWTARQAARAPGDFVECGVSTGFLSSAIMRDLSWNSLSKRFFLFDTWDGLVAEYVSEQERKDGRLDWYKSLSFDAVQRNFAEFERVTLIRGPVPDSLSEADIDAVAYLSLDMNCAAPEIEAAEAFWPKMSPGGFILLDDYAYSGYEEQNVAFNAFARRHGVSILSLPTGQGLIMKPGE